MSIASGQAYAASGYGQEIFQVGKVLCELCFRHFSSVWGAQVGIGLASCNSAIAVSASSSPSWPKLEIPGVSFGVVFGNSQIYKGYDPDYATAKGVKSNPFSSSKLEQHAEQVAITSASDVFCLTPWKDSKDRHHVFVEYSPCSQCSNWIEEHSGNWVVHYIVDYGDTGKQQKLQKCKESLDNYLGSLKVM